jgi:hypothetical protein
MGRSRPHLCLHQDERSGRAEVRSLLDEAHRVRNTSTSCPHWPQACANISGLTHFALWTNIKFAAPKAKKQAVATAYRATDRDVMNP